MAELSYKTHRKYVPMYHFVTFGILLVNLIWSIYKLFRASAWEGPFAAADNLMGVLVAGALLAMFFFLRIFALRVQDRVIRLEERERLARLLPAELAARIGELSVGQLIALRFASDAELPALVKAVIEEKLWSREAIKQRISSWRPDPLRL